jgi:hypothetical protein
MSRPEPQLIVPRCSHGRATTASTPHPVGRRRDDLRLWKLGALTVKSQDVV